MLVDRLGQNIEKALSLAIPVDRICFRNVLRKYERDVLVTTWSAKYGGRYNPPGLAVLYLSCDELTCLKESTHELNIGAASLVAQHFPRVIFAVKVRVAKVLDLTDENVRQAIGASEVDLRETDWFSAQHAYGESFTQTIGRCAKAAGFEALLVPSARYTGNNLNLFYPDGLLPSSTVELLGS